MAICGTSTKVLSIFLFFPLFYSIARAPQIKVHCTPFEKKAMLSFFRCFYDFIIFIWHSIRTLDFGDQIQCCKMISVLVFFLDITVWCEFIGSAINFVFFFTLFTIKIIKLSYFIYVSIGETKTKTKRKKKLPFKVGTEHWMEWK